MATAASGSARSVRLPRPLGPPGRRAKPARGGTKWIRPAAEPDDATSPAVPALLYFDGRGVEKSAAAAAKWARKAARQGKTFAADMMGLEFAADRIER